MKEFDNVEFYMTYRFMVKFPENYNIPVWATQTVEAPKLHKVLVSDFFGFFERTNSSWLPIEVKIVEIIGYNIAGQAMKLFNQGLIQFEIIKTNPQGNPIQTWKISGAIQSIDFGSLSNHLNDISVITLNILPTDVGLTNK